MEFKTIEELVAAVKDGRVDEETLVITLDNDCTIFSLDDGTEDGRKIKVDEGKGYYDIEPLYKLVFPKAKITWC